MKEFLSDGERIDLFRERCLDYIDRAVKHNLIPSVKSRGDASNRYIYSVELELRPENKNKSYGKLGIDYSIDGEDRSAGLEKELIERTIGNVNSSIGKMGLEVAKIGDNYIMRRNPKILEILKGIQADFARRKDYKQ